MKKCQISVISPIYNEEKNIPTLYDGLKNVLDKLGQSYEIIFINDGSRDRSSEILARIASADRLIKIIEFAKNYGQTPAITAGIKSASGKIVILIDSDLQNDPNDIPELVKHIKGGYDVVSGWRKHRKDPFLSKVLPSRVANKIISMVVGVNLHDYGCTLKAYKRDILKNFNLYGEMHRFIPAYAAQSGAKIIEVPVNHHPRKFGISHYSLWRILKVLFDLSTIKFLNDYSTKPLYLFGGIGLSFFFFAVSLFFLVAARVLFFHGGWISPMILLSGLMVVLSFQFILIGLLAEIIVRIYFESQKKSPYIISKTKNL